MLKLERDQISAEAAMLDSMLETLPPNDYLGRIGLESRRNDLRNLLEQLGEQEERRAAVALYFGGEPVVGSTGVEVGFGTRAVGSFQDIVSKVWGTAEGAQLQQMGPITDSEAARLHITNLVHGSFGFLLEELDPDGEPLFETPLKKAADKATEIIASFASEDEARFSSVIEDLHPRVFQSVRDFFANMHRGNATLRMVEGERDERFNRFDIERAWVRAESSKVDEDQLEMSGKLLGIIPIKRRFEFEPDGGQQIVEGKVGERFSHTYLERMSNEQFAGRRWKAVLNRRIITKTGRIPWEQYTLLELDEIEGRR